MPLLSKLKILFTVPVFLTVGVMVSCVGVTDSHSAEADPVVVFSEDFETLPTQKVQSIPNRSPGGESSPLQNGPSPCSRFSIGVAADFKSPNADFQAAQNPSHFVAMNPESPCRGAYGASLVFSPMDLSGYESVEFKARYFRLSMPTWGDDFAITFSASESKFTLDTTALPSVGKWDSVSIKLPASMLKSEVRVRIDSELRFGLDDIQIVGFKNGATSLRDLVRTGPAASLQSARAFDVLGRNIARGEIGVQKTLPGKALSRQ